MPKHRIPLIFIFVFILFSAIQAYTAPAPLPLNRWVTLRADSKALVKDIILSEVEKQDGFSSAVEEKANLKAVEEEKEKEDASYKSAVSKAGKAFTQAKKRRDDLTSQFQATSTEMEEQQKNNATIAAGIENLDSQIARYNQDIKIQQDALKKWLQTEKQGEALVAAIFTQGFKDSAHKLESLADQASAPFMAQHMGTYIQSFTKVVGNTVSVDFIRAIEEGTATWNNEDPLRIVLEKSNKGTTYLRLKRYELYPFQAPQGGKIKPSATGNIKVAIISSRKALDGFLSQNGYNPSWFDLDRVEKSIKDAVQLNTAAEENLQEQVRSFQDRTKALQDKINTARSEKETQIALLARKDVQLKKVSQETATVKARKDEADRAFREAQKTLHDIRRVHESIIIKTALAAARGSQSPAEVSAEAVIDKLAEVKNDAKMQHSSTTTDITNLQVTGESSTQAVSEARITAVRLIAFINEGDSVRVKMAFRVRTVLEELKDDGAPETPRPASRSPEDKKPSRKAPPAPIAATDDTEDKTPAKAPETKKPVLPPVKRNPAAQGAGELHDVLFEIISAKYTDSDLSVYVDMTNLTGNSPRYVAFYDENYRWSKSRLPDNAGKELEVSKTIFWKGQQQTTMYSAGSRGVLLEPRETQTVQLIFKGFPAKQRNISKLILHPWVYQRLVIWTWKEQDLVFQNLRINR